MAMSALLDEGIQRWRTDKQRLGYFSSRARKLSTARLEKRETGTCCRQTRRTALCQPEDSKSQVRYSTCELAAACLAISSTSSLGRLQACIVCINQPPTTYVYIYIYYMYVYVYVRGFPSIAILPCGSNFYNLPTQFIGNLDYQLSHPQLTHPSLPLPPLPLPQLPSQCLLCLQHFQQRPYWIIVPRRQSYK